MQERIDQPEGALPLEEEDEKQGIGDPAYKCVSRMQRQKQKKKKQVETKQNLTNSGRGDTYLRKRVHGVEEIRSQIGNCMLLGELGEIPDSLVDIFLRYQISRYASRILQARVIPKFGKAVL
jgi:hypothetical protein